MYPQVLVHSLEYAFWWMDSDNRWGEPDNQQERPLSAWYVTGFMDGEGCFCASIHPAPTRRGWYMGPVVQAYQHRDRADILERLRAFFGCGRIRPKGPNSSVVTWSVDGLPMIVEKILPHFDQYPLQSGKLQDYLVFREIVLRMRQKEHLNPLGFLELARLAFRMNATGKQRQYSLAMIESGILRGHTPDLLIQRKIWSDLHGDMQSVAEPK
jgi:LAGLIDADG endonuclease